MYIDTHCHLDYPSLADDFTAMLEIRIGGYHGFLVAGARRMDGPVGSLRCVQGGVDRRCSSVYASTLSDDQFGSVMERLRSCFEGAHQACGLGNSGWIKSCPKRVAWSSETVLSATTRVGV